MQSWDFVGLKTPAWVDVPAFAEIQAGPFLGKWAEALAARLRAYHRLPKNEEASLAERQSCLENMYDWLEGEAQCPSQEVAAKQEALLSWLRELAKGKARFLSCLAQIFAGGWHEDEQLFTYLEGQEELAAGPWKPLFLTRERFLFPERDIFWGNYAMECLDPCHRQLPQLFKVWESLPQPKPHYLLWLEEFSTHRHEHWVRYLHSHEADELACHFQGELLVNSRGRPLSCAERQHFLFVIDLEQRLLVQRAESQFCHASFTRGRPVLASGVLQARAGQLQHLKFESGHYLSGPEQWWQAICLLKALGWEQPSGSVRVTVFDQIRFISRPLGRAAFSDAGQFLRELGLRKS